MESREAPPVVDVDVLRREMFRGDGGGGEMRWAVKVAKQTVDRARLGPRI